MAAGRDSTTPKKIGPELRTLSRFIPRAKSMLLTHGPLPVDLWDRKHKPRASRVKLEILWYVKLTDYIQIAGAQNFFEIWRHLPHG